MNSAGNITTLASFNHSNMGKPRSLMLASDGNLYGTTVAEGYLVGHGTIFTITPNGKFTRLATFSGYNGSGPTTKLIEKEGFLYGTTGWGGNHPGAGTFYRIVMPVALNSQVTGNELILSWPTNALGFTLQSAADLNSSTKWMDSTNAPVVVGTQFTVTNLISDAARFYRLKQPQAFRKN